MKLDSRYTAPVDYGAHERVESANPCDVGSGVGRRRPMQQGREGPGRRRRNRPRDRSEAALRITPAGASPFSAWKVESILETAFDWSAALNAGDAGSHGAENLKEASGNLFACACAIAKPSAMMSGRAKAKLAHLRTMHRYYTRLRVRAIRRADEETLISRRRARSYATERLRRLPPV